MNRRKVIKVTLTLEIAEARPLPDLFQQELNQSHYCKKGIHKNLHVVGLGGGGSLTLEHYYNQGLQAEFTCIASKELPKFPSKIKSTRCNVPKNNEGIDDWSNYCIALPDEVKSVFDSNEHFIILVGLGGFTGTLLGKSVFNLLKNRFTNFEFICSFPFRGEGKMRKARAISAFEEFKDYRQFKSFRLDDMSEYGNLTVSEVFRKAKENSYRIFMNSL